MGVEFISVKCPECGANLNIEGDREQAFCTYCGARILLHNENERVYRHIDEAGIRQAEARMREVELAERKYADTKRRQRTYVSLMVIGAVLLFSPFVLEAFIHVGDWGIGLFLLGINLIFWPIILFAIELLRNLFR